MKKKKEHNKLIDTGLTNHDIEVLQIVLEYGLDLLDADGASQKILDAFPLTSAAFLCHLLDHAKHRPTELALVAYCLDVAVDAIAGNIDISPDIRSALSAHMFDIRKLSSRFAKILDMLPES